MTSAMARAPANLGLRAAATAARWMGEATLIAAFLLAGGAMELRLSGLDPSLPVGADSRSIWSEAVFAAADLLLVGYGAVRLRAFVAVLCAGWPLVLLTALAATSALYAPEPVVTLRRAAALGAGVLAMAGIAARRPGWSGLRFLLAVCATGVIASLIWRVVDPRFAVHQAADGVQSVHAGDWRGLFVHRTVLGQLAALTLAAGVWCGRAAFGWRWIQGVVVAASLLALISAHSGGGVFSAALLLATPVVIKAWVMARRRNRVLAVAGAVLSVATSALAAFLSAPMALALLGKDASLTGRLPAWAWMRTVAARRPLLGYGYSSGFKATVARPLAAAQGGDALPNAQNGYLDTMLNLGAVGLVLTGGLLAFVWWKSARLALGEPRGLRLLPLLVTTFTLAFNLGEASLIQANDVFFLIYALAAFFLLQEPIQPFERSP